MTLNALIAHFTALNVCTFRNTTEKKLFIYLYQATRPINIINTNRKRQTETEICRQTDIKAVRKKHGNSTHSYTNASLKHQTVHS